MQIQHQFHIALMKFLNNFNLICNINKYIYIFFFDQPKECDEYWVFHELSFGVRAIFFSGVMMITTSITLLHLLSNVITWCLHR